MNGEYYNIRLANSDELALLQQIEQAASILFQDTKYSFLVDAAPNSLEFLQSHQRSDKVWVVVDSEDQPAGFAVVSFVDGSPHLHEIDIHPAHGRQGLGTRLLNKIIEWARDDGYETVTLSTFRDIPWNAPFYRKHGFKELDESELTEGLLEIRRKESELGLPIEARVCMCVKL